MSLMAGPVTSDDVLPRIAETLTLPGGGHTMTRFNALADLSRLDLPLAKVVEPHHDAVAILTELDGPTPRPGEIWGVWAADPPFAVLTGQDGPSGWTLSGSKAFCSGSDVVTHALVTAEVEDGTRLFAIDRRARGIEEDEDAPGWTGPGMIRADTRTLMFDRVAAQPVGEVDGYVSRPGFWFGAVGIAACWYGGTRGVADAVERSADRLDAHGRAHLGAIRAELATLQLTLESVARRIDHHPDVARPSWERDALVVRTQAADAAERVIRRTGRALGPGPLAFDASHAARVADLQVFVRQHHAERDLERLGSSELG